MEIHSACYGNFFFVNKTHFNYNLCRNYGSVSSTIRASEYISPPLLHSLALSLSFFLLYFVFTVQVALITSKFRKEKSILLIVLRVFASNAQFHGNMMFSIVSISFILFFPRFSASWQINLKKKPQIL